MAESKSLAERLVGLADSLTVALNRFVTKQLEVTSSMGSSYVALVDETLHLLKKSKENYEDRLRQEREIEQMSVSASEEEQTLNSQIAHARAQLDALKERYKAMQAEYHKAVADFEEEKRNAYEALPNSQKNQVKEDLEWRIANYENMLRMRIKQHDDSSILVTFWGLNPADESQEYSFQLITRGNGEISVANPSLEVPNLDLFVADAKITGNIPLLIRRIRRSFLQLAECEDGNQ